MKDTFKYILNEAGDPIPCDDLHEWARWFQKAERHLGDTTIGNVRISTVFLGLDHSFGGPRPILFETMVFGGLFDQEGWRYSTRQEALEGHEKVIAMVRDRETK